jgi:hypothetical protein
MRLLAHEIVINHEIVIEERSIESIDSFPSILLRKGSFFGILFLAGQRLLQSTRGKAQGSCALPWLELSLSRDPRALELCFAVFVERAALVSGLGAQGEAAPKKACGQKVRK